MASSTIHLFSSPYSRLYHPHPSRQRIPPSSLSVPHCSSSSSPSSTATSDLDAKSNPTATTEPSPSEELPEIPPYANTSLEIEKRWKSAILRDSRRSSAVQRPEPPNFEIGWKRTKEIKVEKPKGWVIADFLDKLETLMGRGQFGSPALLAKTGEIVAERAKEEAEVLRAGGEVEERMVTELNRVLRLMEMDMAMVRAAVKEETLAERVEQARARCRQAILVALSF
ncbi:protein CHLORORESPIRATORY REDUCTION 41, chloroplastic [Curcuma longa]|uniref:protein CHLORORESPIRATORY REDUCTION 41, chloroplastic n=1 Tax=Curcuma longa TaxID=136217 RepID=UPI003D9E14B1